MLTKASNIHKKTTLTINILDNFKKIQYIARDTSDFEITLKDYSTRNSTIITDTWDPDEPDELFNFIIQHRRSLSDSTTQQLAAKYAEYVNPQTTEYKLNLLTTLFTEPAKFFEKHC